MPEEPDDLYRGEAEIIPPGQPGAMPRGPIWMGQGGPFGGDPLGSARVRVFNLGPLTLFGMLLSAGLIVALVLFLLVTAVLAAIPIIGLVIAGGFLAAAARRYLGIAR